MRAIRLADSSDLNELQELYLHLNPDRPRLPADVAARIFQQMAERGCHLYVCEVEGRLVSSCMLAIVPNLMRGGLPYALLENVVTHSARRRQGHGRAVVRAALDAAWEEGARFVYLMSARQDDFVQPFYESCGFELGLKAGYVAKGPTHR